MSPSCATDGGGAMQLRRRSRRFDSEEAILTLINVVFLLLIFFMLAGRMTEPSPFAIAPPVSAEAGRAERPAPDATDRRSTRLKSSHSCAPRLPSPAGKKKT